jgi:phage baseplate assembly protein W
MQVDFPFAVGPKGRAAETDENDHVRDMIEQLIFTNHGERVNRPDFGSGAMQLVFAPNSSELAATVQFTLQAALQLWLGDVIEVRRLEVAADDSRLTIELDYLVRATGVVESASFARPA